MGWKSTVTLSREEAMGLIVQRLHMGISNRELGDIMDSIFGDDSNLPYFGHNFIIVDKIEKDENTL
jgi:hypothetical protein